MVRRTGLMIGTAGWTIPQPQRDLFPAIGTHLERYAKQLPAVEINSTFYRSHRTATYHRWAASVPEDFRFSVKVPRELTHERQLHDYEEPLASFIHEVRELGPKLGPCLVQLPPSFAFDRSVVSAFFRSFRAQFPGDIVCEPRHRSWSEAAAEETFLEFGISRVIADPEVIPGRTESHTSIVYYRLHGSPRIYYSEYSPGYLSDLATQVRTHQVAGRRVWCIFDNTALGAAAGNAVELQELIKKRDRHGGA